MSIAIDSNRHRYKCRLCPFKTDYSSKFREHHLTHTKEKPFQCNFCPKTFSQKCNCIRHMRTHTKEKPFTCKECDSKFSTRHNLTVHMLIHSDDMPYSCLYCERRFRHQSAAKRHHKCCKNVPRVFAETGDSSSCPESSPRSDINTLNVYPPFINTVATTQISPDFGTQFGLNAPFDFNVHTPQIQPLEFPGLTLPPLPPTQQPGQPLVLLNSEIMGEAYVGDSSQSTLCDDQQQIFFCETCARPFDNPRALRSHSRKHSRGTTLQCPRCPFSFANQSDLDAHLFGHDRPYLCFLASCQKSFYTEDELVRHNLIEHSNELQSEICSTKRNAFQRIPFKTKRKVGRPKRLTPAYRFICPVCNSVFESSDELLQHTTRLATDDPTLRCAVCRMAFCTVDHSAFHATIHVPDPSGPLCCWLCMTVVGGVNELSEHLEKHSKNLPSLPCQECGSVFRTHRGYADHCLAHVAEVVLGNPEFQCDKCQSRFVSEAELRVHVASRSGSESFRCEYCNDDFCYESALWVHQQSCEKTSSSSIHSGTDSG
eukprot:430022_1